MIWPTTEFVGPFKGSIDQMGGARYRIVCYNSFESYN